MATIVANDMNISRGPSTTKVGNWPKKSSALALEIVSLKCNALVIMH